jgi:oxygen-independent coproporphyrinogen III oxidase
MVCGHNELMKSSTELIHKYNHPAPRYTSYPPVPFWNNTPEEAQWISHLQASYDANTGLDLYVHVPYCESLCYYCGCSRTITRDHGVEANFVELLLTEWQLYQDKLGFTPAINSLHFGGGTPTFLSPEHLELIIQTLTANKRPHFFGSIEIDPRTCQDGHLQVMQRNGIVRASLGIQDFDPSVQAAINRQQPPHMVTALVKKIRQLGIPSLNFDLIYGLPRQTLASITQTIELVSELRPELIAFYSYAHLPEKIKNQKLIAPQELPAAELKRELYETGKALLLQQGYIEIGMDHFALPGSYLYEAKLQQQLHRNFMGYVDKKSSILLGLGPTAISDSSQSFIQNEKELKLYQQSIQSGKLPIEKGHTHQPSDLVVQEIILQLMCGKKAKLTAQHLPYWEQILDELQSFEQDGILELAGDELSITELGQPFLRNVAMSFDYHLRERSSTARFSQTI